MNENSALQYKHNLYEPKFPSIQFRRHHKKNYWESYGHKSAYTSSQSDELPLLVSTNNLLLLSIMSRPSLEGVHHSGKESKQVV